MADSIYDPSTRAAEVEAVWVQPTFTGEDGRNRERDFQAEFARVRTAFDYFGEGRYKTRIPQVRNRIAMTVGGIACGTAWLRR